MQDKARAVLVPDETARSQADYALQSTRDTSRSLLLDRGSGRPARPVLVLLARGRSNPEIAAELSVSRKTVGSHIEHIFTKLGVSTRTEAALFAMRHGLLPHPPTS